MFKGKMEVAIGWKLDKIKLIAVITVISFVISTVGLNLYAIPTQANDSKKYEEVFNKVDRAINLESGKITGIKDVKSDITVVNIQDLHCHPQTQKNISKIIGQLAKKYKIKKVYVEGGYGEIDTGWIEKIRDEKIKREVIEKLLEEGILTGSEYYKLTSEGRKVELKGLDEERIHKGNLKRLAWIIGEQGKYREVTKNIDKEIGLLEKRYINLRNKRFNKSYEQYLLGKIDTKRFYRQVLKYVKEINKNPQRYNNITSIKIEDYPNIARYIALTSNVDNMNMQEVKAQLQKLMVELKNRVPYGVYKKMIEDTDNLRDSRKVVDLALILSERANINLEGRYRQLKSFLEANRINKEINPIELVQEEREIIEQVRYALSYNNEEYEITYIMDFNKYFKEYLGYKLTEADWQYYKKGFKKFEEIYGKYATVNRIEEIAEDFKELNKYYRINDIRNEIFVGKMLTGIEPGVIEEEGTRQEEEILRNSKEVIVAITGGFHSGSLEELLAKEGVNTIVIMPSIYAEVEGATKKYKEVIEEQSKQIQYQALAYTVMSNIADTEKRKILLSIIKDLSQENKNILEELKQIFGDKVDVEGIRKEIEAVKERDIKQEGKTKIKEAIKVAIDELKKILPKEGLKGIVVPDNKIVDKIMIELAEKLVDMGINISEGVIYEIESSNYSGKEIEGIAPEIYSRMAASLQKALLKAQQKKDGKVEEGNKGNNEKATFKKIEKLTEGVNELSIVQDSNSFWYEYAHIWEEVVFRILPLTATMVVSILSMTEVIAFPFWIVGLIGLAVFIVMQVIFVFLHKKGEMVGVFKASKFIMFLSLFFIVSAISLAYLIYLFGIAFNVSVIVVKVYTGLFSIPILILITVFLIHDHHEHNKEVRAKKTDLPLLTIFGSGEARKDNIKQKYPNIVQYLSEKKPEFLTAIINNKNDKDIINILNTIEEKMKEGNKETDNVIDKFFKNVSSYGDFVSISDMLKDDVGDYLNKRKKIEDLKLEINKFKINSIFFYITYAFDLGIGSNFKGNEKIRNFLLSHEEILNSFFNEYGKIKNKEILKEIGLLIKNNYDLDNIFKDVKTFEDLQSKLCQEEKENKIDSLMSWEFVSFFNPEEINKEYFNLSFKKIRDFLSSHEEILNSFFNEDGQIKNEGILKKMARLVKIHCNLDNIFKDIKTFEDLQSKLYEEEKENKINSLMSWKFVSFFSLEEIDKEYFKLSFRKIIDFFSSHEEILNSFFNEDGQIKNEGILEELAEAVKYKYNHLEKILKAVNFEDLILKIRYEMLNFLLEDIEHVSENVFAKEIKESMKNKIKYIFSMLAHINIKIVKEKLVFRILVDKYFNDKINVFAKDSNKMYETHEELVKYHCAIAVSRFIYDCIGEVSGNIDQEKTKNIIKNATDAYLQQLYYAQRVSLTDADTNVFCLYNDETIMSGSRFYPQGLIDILKFIDGRTKVTGEDKNLKIFKADKKSWLDEIRNFGKEGTEHGKGFFYFSGHGEEYSLTCNFNKTVYISIDELAVALEEASKNVDLKNITINLNCCKSYFFAKNLYKKLKELGVTTFPTIITEAGFENRYGITVQYNYGGNLIVGIVEGIKKLLEKDKQKSIKNLTLYNLVQMEAGFKYSNSTFFSSFTGEQEAKINKYKEEIIEIYKENNENATFQKIEGLEVLPEEVYELSISKDESSFWNKYAHIWEEVVFRILPSTATMVVSILSMTGVIAFQFWIVGLIGLAVFIVMQVIFVFLHKPAEGETKEGYHKRILQASWKIMLVGLCFFCFAIFLPYLFVAAFVFSQNWALYLFILFTAIAVTTLFIKPILIFFPFYATIYMHKKHNENVKNSKTKLPLLTIHSNNKEEYVKKVVLEYKSIKASDIDEMVKDIGIGAEIKVKEEGGIEVSNIAVMIVEDIEEANRRYKLENIGIKVKGNSIYKIKGSGIIVYGAKGVKKEEISEVLTVSQNIKEEIAKLIRAKTGQEVSIEVEGIIEDKEEGIRFEEGITKINEEEIKGKTGEYIKGYIASVMEIKRAKGVMYSQKAVVSLEKIDGKDKVKEALRNGKVRKIISKEQYRDLRLSAEYIIGLREEGIEIYVVDEDIREGNSRRYKESGISGQIIKEGEKIYIYDYYSEDKVEMEIITEKESLQDIEKKIVYSQKPIYIDIKVLEEKFKKERDITKVHRQIEALIGNIKIKTGIGEISKEDIENIGYSLDYNKLPILKEAIDKEEFMKMGAEEFMKGLEIKENSEIAIIMKTIKKEEIRESFIRVIKERILAKAELKKNNKEYGLKDKKLEQLLGRMLVKQIGNSDKLTKNLEETFKGSKEEIIKKILEEQQKVEQGTKEEKEVAINTIIEIILVYAQENKKGVIRETKEEEIQRYRAMLCAA